MGLLDNSATFLGVLLTLNVLCIFYNPTGNFIFGTLISQKDRFVRRLTRLQNQLLSKKKRFMESADYATVTEIANGKNLSAQDAFALQFKSTQVINSYSIDISSFFGDMEQVEKSNEQFNAPLFSLFFGLIVFVCDELINYKHLLMSEIIFVLYILTVLSIIYWALVWGAFIFRQDAPNPEPEELRKLDECIGIWSGSVLKYTVCYIIYYLILKNCIYPLDLHASGTDYISWEILISIVFPISLIGFIRFVFCRVKGKYSSAHVLGHLLSFTVYAIIMLITTCNIASPQLISVGFLDDERTLRLVIIAFVLINGVLAPFICPYLKYSWYFLTTRSRLRRLKKEMEESIRSFNIEFTRFCVEKVKREARH